MERKRFSLELSESLLKRIDQLKNEWGLRSRGLIVERLLLEILPNDEIDDGSPAADDVTPALPQQGQVVLDLDQGDQSDFDEGGALVLVAHSSGGLSVDVDGEDLDPLHQRKSGGSSQSTGIDLPGFVRKQSAQLKRSLDPKKQKFDLSSEPMPMASGAIIDRALGKARNHWIELYGHEANEAVLDAALLWLAKDIWPTSDQSEGRPFTWSLASLVIESLASGWTQGPASFERIMVVAGILEDPFSASTLELRLPTLIRRFVNRFRRRKQGTSFATLEHTMTLHGALKLLNLPTAPGHRLTLTQIRDGYREMALQVHPDSGGSEEGMRKVNEAYQLLKELYRKDQ